MRIFALFAYLSVGSVFAIGFGNDEWHKCHQIVPNSSIAWVQVMWLPIFAGVIGNRIVDSRPFPHCGGR